MTVYLFMSTVHFLAHMMHAIGNIGILHDLVMYDVQQELLDLIARLQLLNMLTDNSFPRHSFHRQSLHGSHSKIGTKLTIEI